KNAGTYTVEFDASNLSSGIYFYKLESNGFIAIKKMMLLK
ncbi:MAG: T9SS type A sorting domain-containing protein, partial [Ignavibacteria bacterium]|nr:T9SS type A sorting domain-containing protein [Ignavibacteria bacterium]